MRSSDRRDACPKQVRIQYSGHDSRLAKRGYSHWEPIGGVSNVQRPDCRDRRNLVFKKHCLPRKVTRQSSKHESNQKRTHELVFNKDVAPVARKNVVTPKRTVFDLSAGAA